MDEKPKTKVMADGRIAFLDEQGNVVGVQGHNKRNKKRIAEGLPPTKMVAYSPWSIRHNRNGKAFMVLGGTSGNPNRVRDIPDDYCYFDEHAELLTEICARVGDGMTLTQIENIPMMPPARAIRWFEANDEKFRNMMAASRRDRAERYADKIASIADTVDESTSKSAKVSIDSWKWLAEVGDRERFGAQTKHLGDANNPISFIIDTGIHDAPIPAEGNVIEYNEADTSSDGVPTEEPAEGDSPETKEI